MIITLAITRDQSGPEFAGDYATIYDALNGAVVALLRYPYSHVDALDDDGAIMWYAWRENIHVDYVTVAGDITGRIDISDHVNPGKKETE